MTCDKEGVRNLGIPCKSTAWTDGAIVYTIFMLPHQNQVEICGWKLLFF